MSGLFKTIGKKIQRFIERLAQVNKESLGDEPLDCCSLDKGEGRHAEQKK